LTIISLERDKGKKKKIEFMGVIKSAKKEEFMQIYANHAAAFVDK